MSQETVLLMWSLVHLQELDGRLYGSRCDGIANLELGNLDLENRTSCTRQSRS